MEWEIVHECDDENGNPTQWAAVINRLADGAHKFCWIIEVENGYSVEVASRDGDRFIELALCKSLVSAKRWVTIHLG